MSHVIDTVQVATPVFGTTLWRDILFAVAIRTGFGIGVFSTNSLPPETWAAGVYQVLLQQ